MNKHEAILPDGSVAKRNSQNRVYSHCVAFRRDYAAELAEAGKKYGHMVHNHEYAIAVVRGEHKHSAWEHACKGSQKAVDRYGYDAAAAVDQMIAERVAWVENAKAEGLYERWFVEGWNGRLDLARKLAASVSVRRNVAEVRIIVASVQKKGA